jgi:protein-disulfide isomerase
MQKIKHLFKSLFQKLYTSTPVAIIIGAIILGASHVGYGMVMSKGQASPTTAFKGRAIDESDLATGNVKSKVILVEYSDTECPFCAQVHPTLKQIKEEYDSKLGFVYRYFPLTQIHPHAFEEARAVFCVGKELGAKKRQDYIDSIFDTKINAKNMVLQNGQKELLAKNIGVNEATFKSCMSNQESNDAINASIQDGIAAGVQGTPATLYKKPM